MRRLLTLEQALVEAKKPKTFTLTIRAEDAPKLNLPDTWIHATALDRNGEVTFLDPERLIRHNAPFGRTRWNFRSVS